MQNVQDLLKVWLLLTSLILLIVLHDIDSIPIDDRWKIEWLLGYPLQERIFNHDLKFLSFIINFRNPG